MCCADCVRLPHHGVGFRGDALFPLDERAEAAGDSASQWSPLQFDHPVMPTQAKEMAVQTEVRKLAS